MSENAGGQGTPSTTSNAASTTAPAADANAAAKPAAPKPKANPAFRALGMPNFRLRLPSRNWTIFLSIVGSWTAAIVYDRRQKKAAQKKWCTLVEHIAQESLPTNSLARRVTIILSAPPGDGLRVAREHFTEYVKPILVAGALDWDVIEGRREGEVRSGLADKIRTLRRRKGETSDSDEPDSGRGLGEIRARAGIQDFQGEHGDIVIGRHTWKEYVRGLHEGWLGPMAAPKPIEDQTTSPEPGTPSASTEEEAKSEVLLSSQSEDESSSEVSNGNSQDASTAESQDPPPKPDEAKNAEEKKAEKPKKPAVSPAHNSPSSYGDSTLPYSFPSELPASVPIPLPHMLGVINTPKRIYRFLTRRHLADEVGRQTAAAVLAAYRPYRHGLTSATAEGDQSSEFSAETMGDDAGQHTSKESWEQQDVLVQEEPEWHKSARKRTEGEGERVWLDDMVIDPRIGGRMRKFELAPGEEERAKRIAKGAVSTEGRRAGDEGIPDGESQL